MSEHVAWHIEQWNTMEIVAVLLVLFMFPVKRNGIGLPDSRQLHMQLIGHDFTPASIISSLTLHIPAAFTPHSLSHLCNRVSSLGWIAAVICPAGGSVVYYSPQYWIKRARYPYASNVICSSFVRTVFVRCVYFERNSLRTRKAGQGYLHWGKLITPSVKSDQHLIIPPQKSYSPITCTYVYGLSSLKTLYNLLKSVAFLQTLT